jgi:hypothetical protein
MLEVGLMSIAIDSQVSVELEYAESLHDAIDAFLVLNPAWDYQRVVEASIALFLLNQQSPLQTEVLVERLVAAYPCDAPLREVA